MKFLKYLFLIAFVLFLKDGEKIVIPDAVCMVLGGGQVSFLDQKGKHLAMMDLDKIMGIVYLKDDERM
jgi:hypothetical protein